MKYFFFIFCILGFSTANAQKCLDFSGSYKLEIRTSEQPVNLIITQSKCKRIVLNYAYSKHGSEVFELNRKRVKHAEFPEVGLVLYATPYLKDNDIIIDIENVWDDGQIDKFKRRLHLEYGKETLLLDQLGDFRSDGVFVPSTQTIYQKN